MSLYRQTISEMSHEERLEELQSLQRIRHSSDSYIDEVRIKTDILLSHLGR